MSAATFQVTKRLEQQLQRAAELHRTHARTVTGVARQLAAFTGRFASLPLPLRFAESFAAALTNEPVLLFPDEKLHGLFIDDLLGGDREGGFYGKLGELSWQNVLDARLRRDLPELAVLAPVDWADPVQTGESFIMSRAAFPGHIAWDYSLILSLGVEGLAARYDEALRRARDDEQRHFYQAVLICLRAMLDWNQKHVAELSRWCAAAEDPARRQHLAECIAIMQRVPAQPARNFREALQSYLFQHVCVMYEAPFGGNSPGRLDAVLWPYLKEEYETGKLTYQDAAELVAELFIKMDQRIHPYDGYVEAIAVGGTGPDGTDAVTPLTYMMIDAVEQLDLTHPAIYTRLGKANAESYRDRCVDYLLKGRNRAQILNDDAIIPAMLRDGRMTRDEAATYMCGGCMEVSPQGLGGDLLYSFVVNVPKVLELSLTGGYCLVTRKQRLPPGPDLTGYATFDDCYAAFAASLKQVFQVKFRQLDLTAETWAEYRPLFLQSSMIHDCLETGREQNGGGARYPDYGGSPMGMQNAADALYAVKRAVFEDRLCTAAELLAALKADFTGYESLHAQLLALPKYGQDDESADAMMRQLTQSVSDIFDAHTTRRGGRVKQIILTFIWAAQMGASIGALPDGRRAGTPIAHGLTPQGAAMTKGLTSAITSYGKLDSTLFTGGASTMWDMDSRWIDHGLLKAVVTAFCALDGQIFQGNMTSVAELEEAIRDPARHPHLIVRVGGYSSRLANLPKAVQLEVLNRYRHHGT